MGNLSIKEAFQYGDERVVAENPFWEELRKFEEYKDALNTKLY